MKSLYALLAVIYLSSTVTGFIIQNDDTTEYIKLENLCENDRWYYKNLPVNSFYATKLNYSFGAVGQYLFPEDLDLTEYFEKENDAAGANEAIEFYNTQMMNAFTAEFFSPANLKKIQDEIMRIRSYQSNLRNHQARVKDSFQEKFESHIKFFENGVEFFNKVQLFNDNSVAMKLDKFKSFIMSLKIDPKNQSFVFKNDQITKIYKQKLVKVDRFIFNRNSKEFYDYESTGVLEYSINLPFTNMLYKNAPCIHSDTLPSFFSKKVDA